MAVAQRVNNLAKQLDDTADVVMRLRDRLGNAEKEMAEITRSIQRMAVDVENRAALQEAQRDRLSLLEARVIGVEEREGTLADTVYQLRDNLERLTGYVGRKDATAEGMNWSEPTATHDCNTCECCP